MSIKTATALKRSTPRAAALLAVAALAGLGAAPANAAARPEPGDPPTPSTPVIVREVRVPVDDTNTEITQMALAAAISAVLASAIALRHGSHRTSRTRSTSTNPAHLDQARLVVNSAD